MIKKAFVPICLYSKGFFLEKENLKYFLYSFSDYDEILFLIIDELYGHNLLIKNKTKSFNRAKILAEKRGIDIYNFSKNIISEFADNNLSKTKFKLSRWNEYAKLKMYLNLYQKIKYEINKNSLLKEVCDKFINYNLINLTDEITNTKLLLEEDYLFSEMTMSILLTEYLGYSIEIWEKPPNPNIPDPISVLYDEGKKTLLNILNKKETSRNQFYLTELIPEIKDFYNISFELEMRE